MFNRLPKFAFHRFFPKPLLTWRCHPLPTHRRRLLKLPRNLAGHEELTDRPAQNPFRHEQSNDRDLNTLPECVIVPFTGRGGDVHVHGGPDACEDGGCAGVYDTPE